MKHKTMLQYGAIALIVSAMLTLGGLLLRGPLINNVSNPQVFADWAVSPNNLLAETFLPLSLVIQLFGFLGIYAYLQKPETQSITFWGMVFSIFGNGLFLPFAGVFAFAMPIIGKLYLNGNTDAIHVAELTLAPGTGFAYLIASAFALTIGSALFAVSMRRHGLPRWLTAMYFIQSFALSFGASIHYGLELTGGVLLTVCSFAIGIKMWKDG